MTAPLGGDGRVLLRQLRLVEAGTQDLHRPVLVLVLAYPGACAHFLCGQKVGKKPPEPLVLDSFITGVQPAVDHGINGKILVVPSEPVIRHPPLGEIIGPDESGAHRVQRVPVTESSGRIQTSAATVAVLPEAEEVDFHIDPSVTLPWGKL